MNTQNIFSKTLVKYWIIAVSMAALPGCSSHVSDDGFPAPESAWIKGGTFIDPNSVLRVTEGLNKNQVRELLGSPQFSEGMINVKEWNYVFNFYTQGKHYLSCQYQVQYDNDMKVAATRWRDPQCAAHLVPVTGKGSDHLMLNGDLLFGFDSAVLGPEGRRALDRVAAQLQEDGRTSGIRILGYTDSLGDANYNLRLSQQRAEAVKDYLVTRGLSRSGIEATGLGEAGPVASCAGITSQTALRECLQSDRRVEILTSKAG